MSFEFVFSAGWDSPAGVFVLPVLETSLSRPPSKKMAAVVETVSEPPQQVDF